MAGSVFRVPSRAFVRKRKSEAAPHGDAAGARVCVCVFYELFTSSFAQSLFRPRAEAREKEGAGVRHKGRDRKDGTDR